MVKGVSRRVIVVRSPDQKLFEQAIFILNEDAKGVTDEMLLREAKLAARSGRRKFFGNGPLWACGGMACTGIVWLMTVIF